MSDNIDKKNAENYEPNLNWLENIQSSIVRRLNRSNAAKEPIVYEFTQDRALLHQYYRLRQIMYRRMFNTEKFIGEEDVHDKISHILIARQGKLCIGGCRLTLRDPDEDFPLPMEGEGFKLRDAFPNLRLTQYRHAELSRYAIMEGHSEREVMYSLCQIISNRAIMEGARYVFAKSTYNLARNWRMIGNRLVGVKSRICSEVSVPENPIHPEIQWYITLFDTAEKMGVEEAKAATIQLQMDDEQRIPELLH